MQIGKGNVGKIAERIVMNELDARGYRTTDLNKDGLSANADILAAKDGRVWQIQVKGSSVKPKERWWVQYGYCNDDQIDRRSPIFNRKNSFYVAKYVVFVAVKTPSAYECCVLRASQAEAAAQLNLDRYYRRPGKDGKRRKPGKVWVHLEKSNRERQPDDIAAKLKHERKKLQDGRDQWDLS